MTQDLVVYGLSHHGTPLAVREKLAAPADRVEEELKQLLAPGFLGEGVLLSTCNRIELIGISEEPHRMREALLAYWNQRVHPERVDGFVYEHRGTGALRHLFRVAAVLDSMVLGEPQILGQVKAAFGLASAAGSVGPLLWR